jgi:hypothetical protein
MVAARARGLAALFCTLTYLLILGGHAYSGDEVLAVRLTAAIVDRGEVEVQPLEAFPDYSVLRDDEGRAYSWYGLGLSVAGAPFYAAGKLLREGISEEDLGAFDAPRILYYDRRDADEVIPTFATVATNAVVSGLTLWLLMSVLTALGMGAAPTVIAALVFAFTGCAPFYAKTFFSEPLAGLFLLGALWALIRAGADNPPKERMWLFAAGLCLGVSALTRVAHLALVLPFFAAILVAGGSRERREPGSSNLRARAFRVVWASLGIAIPVLVIAGYNAARFGSPFETGYGDKAAAFTNPFWEGFAGLLVSPGRGMLWYFPWVVPAVWGLHRLARQSRAAAVFAGGAFLALLLLYSRWFMWEGGWCFGPRFLVPVMPLLAVPAALAIHGAWQRPAAKRLFALVCFISAMLALQSVLVSFVDYSFAMHQLVEDSTAALRWSLEWAPLVAYWSFPLKEFLIAPRLLVGEGGATLAALMWCVVVLWAAAGAALLMALRGLPRGTTGEGPSAMTAQQ